MAGVQFPAWETLVCLFVFFLLQVFIKWCRCSGGDVRRELILDREDRSSDKKELGESLGMRLHT